MRKAIAVLLFLGAVTLQISAKEKVGVSGFSRDGQPIEFKKIECEDSGEGRAVCVASLKNLAEEGITALGYRTEALYGGLDHEFIGATTTETIDFVDRLVPGEKTRGPIGKNEKYDISFTVEGQGQRAPEWIHFHILFVELRDGTLAGGIQEEFRWIYESLVADRSRR